MLLFSPQRASQDIAVYPPGSNDSMVKESLPREHSGSPSYSVTKVGRRQQRDNLSPCQVQMDTGQILQYYRRSIRTTKEEKKLADDIILNKRSQCTQQMVFSEETSRETLSHTGQSRDTPEDNPGERIASEEMPTRTPLETRVEQKEGWCHCGTQICQE